MVELSRGEYGKRRKEESRQLSYELWRGASEKDESSRSRRSLRDLRREACRASLPERRRQEKAKSVRDDTRYYEEKSIRIESKYIERFRTPEIKSRILRLLNNSAVSIKLLRFPSQHISLPFDSDINWQDDILLIRSLIELIYVGCLNFLIGHV